ncbi:drug/metabolite transporter permease [Klebsiella pneumoniae]|uniref:Drug/metabolite transporter permease n=1 Tax=Klebsiella pneumoniae TaxID=573 RepID=A0A378FX84_KLEPN|nr:drug/metabolite transporter permease [Klebsiella pneumoniae]
MLLLAVWHGFVTLAEHQHVPSGIAAVMVATVPLFTLCFSRFFGIATRKLEWLALPLACGYRDAQQRRQPERQPLGRTADPDWFPKLGLRLGLRFANRTADRHDGGAIEMLAAGIVLLVASWLSGETLTRVPSWSGIAALAYLAIFGSLIAINAYMFLIRNVTPAVATSYAYVNPVVAVLLGTGSAARACRSLSGWRWR